MFIRLLHYPSSFKLTLLDILEGGRAGRWVQVGLSGVCGSHLCDCINFFTVDQTYLRDRDRHLWRPFEAGLLYDTIILPKLDHRPANLHCFTFVRAVSNRNRENQIFVLATIFDLIHQVLDPSNFKILPFLLNQHLVLSIGQNWE